MTEAACSGAIAEFSDVVVTLSDESKPVSAGCGSDAVLVLVFLRHFG